MTLTALPVSNTIDQEGNMCRVWHVRDTELRFIVNHHEKPLPDGSENIAVFDAADGMALDHREDDVQQIVEECLTFSPSLPNSSMPFTNDFLDNLLKIAYKAQTSELYTKDLDRTLYALWPAQRQWLDKYLWKFVNKDDPEARQEQIIRAALLIFDLVIMREKSRIKDLEFFETQWKEKVTDRDLPL